MSTKQAERAASAPSAEKKRDEQVPVVNRAGLRLREQANDHWVVNPAPKGTTVEHLERADFWSAVSGQHGLKPYDFVVVVADDESWVAECLVRDAVPGSAVVKVLRVVDLGPKIGDAGENLPPDHRIRRGNAEEGWIVERTNPDGSVTVMAKGEDYGRWTRADAVAWLLNHATVRDWKRASAH